MIRCLCTHFLCGALYDMEKHVAVGKIHYIIHRIFFNATPWEPPIYYIQYWVCPCSNCIIYLAKSYIFQYSPIAYVKGEVTRLMTDLTLDDLHDI